MRSRRCQNRCRRRRRGLWSGKRRQHVIVDLKSTAAAAAVFIFTPARVASNAIVVEKVLSVSLRGDAVTARDRPCLRRVEAVNGRVKLGHAQEGGELRARKRLRVRRDGQQLAAGTGAVATLQPFYVLELHVRREARDDPQVRVLGGFGKHRDAVVKHARTAAIRVVLVAKGSDGSETVRAGRLWSLADNVRWASLLGLGPLS